MTETIVGSRWKSSLLLVGCLVFVVLGLWLPNDGDTETMLVKWGVILLFGLGVPVAIYQLVSPQQLILDSRGLTYTGLFNRTWSVPWSDIETLKLWTPPRAWTVRMIAWDYRPGRGPNSAMSRLSQGLGAGGALPSGWTAPPKVLLEKMNQRLQASRR